MRIHIRRERPEPWEARRSHMRHAWTKPFLRIEHALEWLAYILNRWTFLEVLEYLSSFGVLIAVIFYFAESGDRLKQKHYQAWQVVNSAQGKGGNGGRIEALEELNADGVPLVGVDLSSAFLQGVRLNNANLSRANLDAADARDAVLQGARLDNASLRSTNLRGATFQGASLRASALDEADLTGAMLRGADFAGVSLEGADLHDANLDEIKWKELQSVKGANIRGVKQPPQGFREWALAHGAVDLPANQP